VSHIGGHKWAGNVIIYLPPGYTNGSEDSVLAGRGIWYGRVEPRHVEGIIKETILGDKVIKDLFRGATDQVVPSEISEGAP
jgi:(2Fe-2S) ferredoxin